MILKVLFNYSILFLCIIGFSGGAVTDLILPVLQLYLCWFNYEHSRNWPTVLMLEVHLLISTILGLYFEGYLYLRYISNDAESILVFREILKIGIFLVCVMGIITTSLKYLSTKKIAQK